MPFQRIATRLVLVLAGSIAVAIPAATSTFVRQGLDRLTAESEVIVQGRVLDIHSYWNAAHSFILTDVTVRPSQWLKGADRGDLTLTLMGGSVGDVTTLIIGGPDLAPGLDYVLFLGAVDLPDAPGRLAVRDHAQGVFEVRLDRAFSQAIGEPLVPDALGRTEVAGGEAGFVLAELIGQVRELIHR